MSLVTRKSAELQLLPLDIKLQATPTDSKKGKGFYVTLKRYDTSGEERKMSFYWTETQEVPTVADVLEDMFGRVQEIWGFTTATEWMEAHFQKEPEYTRGNFQNIMADFNSRKTLGRRLTRFFGPVEFHTIMENLVQPVLVGHDPSLN